MVCFVDSSEVVDHQYLNSLFIRVSSPKCKNVMCIKKKQHTSNFYEITFDLVFSSLIVVDAEIFLECRRKCSIMHNTEVLATCY